MPNWIPLCSAADAPADGEVAEVEAAGRAICLARVEGKLHAVDNWCPHRQGPLGQGSIEGGTVLCPWHAWAFDLATGVALPPERAAVAVFPLEIEGETVLIDLG